MHVLAFVSTSVEDRRPGDRTFVKRDFLCTFYVHKKSFFVSESSSFAELAATPKQEGFISWTMFIV